MCPFEAVVSTEGFTGPSRYYLHLREGSHQYHAVRAAPRTSQQQLDQIPTPANSDHLKRTRSTSPQRNVRIKADPDASQGSTFASTSSSSHSRFSLPNQLLVSSSNPAQPREPSSSHPLIHAPNRPRHSAPTFRTRIPPPSSLSNSLPPTKKPPHRAISLATFQEFLKSSLAAPLLLSRASFLYASGLNTTTSLVTLIEMDVDELREFVGGLGQTRGGEVPFPVLHQKVLLAAVAKVSARLAS